MGVGIPIRAPNILLLTARLLQDGLKVSMHDASTGQNGLQQAQLFKEAVSLSGLILTKLDGTAKGGCVLAVHRQLDLPVKFVGLGEKIEDLEVFEPELFVEAILPVPNSTS